MSAEDRFQDESLLKLWALGTVTRDKPFGVDIIMVTPTERDTMQKGDPSIAEDSIDQKVDSPTGVAGGQTLKGTKEMPATWFPDGDNYVMTSPMVRVGETVKLYKYADKDELFWTTVYREPSLRRIERFVIGASNLSSPGDPFDLESAYSMDFDTLSKAIRIRTTHSDGEKFSYTLELFPKESLFRVMDNVGNIICLDSENTNVYLEDISGGRFETRDGHPRIYGPKGVFIETPAQFHVQAGDTLINAGSNLVNGPTTFSDPVSMNATLSLASNFTMGGGGGGATASFAGQIQLLGSMDVSGGASFGGYVSLNGGHTPD